MLLEDIRCNTDPKVILQNIADHVNEKSKRLQDCHSKTGNAIKNGKVDKNDRLIIMGHGKMGMHSIIVDPNNNIKIDSFEHKIKKINKKTLTITYSISNNNAEAEWTLTPIVDIPIKKFVDEYEITK